MTGDDTVIEGEHLTVSQETHRVNLIFLHFPRRLRGIEKKKKSFLVWLKPSESTSKASLGFLWKLKHRLLEQLLGVK